jgi:hypothetical protein
MRVEGRLHRDFGAAIDAVCRLVDVGGDRHRGRDHRRAERGAQQQDRHALAATAGAPELRSDRDLLHHDAL